MYNVLVVDDQKIPRQYFEMMTASSGDFKLVQALDSAMVADIYCSKYQVDLVVMDIVMSDGSNGLDAAARIKKNYPDIKVIIVTSMIESAYLEKARNIGADSFWYKESSEDELLSVMRRTMAGERVWPDEAPEVALGMASSRDLSPAELSVLREMTTGATNKLIAERLGIEPSTVKTHISNMLQKTGFDNRTELAIEARLKGLVVSEGSK